MKQPCNDPKPFGYWTRAHIVADPRCPYGDYFSLSTALNNPINGMPRLEPVMRAGNLYLYTETAVDTWLAAHAQWKAEEPQRRAANKAAELARVGTLTPEAVEQMRVNAIRNDILEQGLRASAEERAARSEYFAQRGWKE